MFQMIASSPSVNACRVPHRIGSFTSTRSSGETGPSGAAAAALRIAPSRGVISSPPPAPITTSAMSDVLIQPVPQPRSYSCTRYAPAASTTTDATGNARSTHTATTAHDRNSCTVPIRRSMIIAIIGVFGIAGAAAPAWIRTNIAKLIQRPWRSRTDSPTLAT